jgi:hypothetical protein
MLFGVCDHLPFTSFINIVCGIFQHAACDLSNPVLLLLFCRFIVHPKPIYCPWTEVLGLSLSERFHVSTTEAKP